MDDKLLKYEEKIIYSLRSLYKKYGYLPYQMSKFEEYELYIRNKDFMVSDRVIAFNDTNGKLLALKPDVTLSIIKSGDDVKGVKQKVYYNENVYRVSQSTHRYKEIMQAGLECIGDTDLYDIFEVISLGAESLAKISEKFVLTVSHIGVVSSVLQNVCPEKDFSDKAMKLVSEKNTHDLSLLCKEYGVNENDYSKLCSLIGAYGNRQTVIEKIKGFVEDEYVKEIEKLSNLLKSSRYSDKIQFDFSLVSDTKYYNGFVFKGFVDGISSGVLSGGQYDKMMSKMGRSSKAVGFALYLDMLEYFNDNRKDYDVDFLVLYDDNIDSSKIVEKVSDLVNKGFSCSAQKEIPEKLRYKEIFDMRKKGDN